MAQWYVKDLSKLTHVSVQTLHHYDRIGLLEPSLRLSNGYRLYSEKDLLKLQRIIALKYFGFELAQIKLLLSEEVNVLEHFSVQSQFLEEKAKMLFEASQTLKNIISDGERNKSIPWETIIKLIEVYRMTHELEKTWAGKVLNAEELKQYAHFEQGLKTRFTKSEQQACETDWAALVSEVKASISKDPSSDFGMALGKRCMAWVNNLYGKEFAKLRSVIWEKGFKGGEAAAEYNVPQEVVAWLDKAIDAYYRKRVYSVLKQVETKSHQEVLVQWEALLEEMYGEERSRSKELLSAIMEDEQVSQAAKNWVKKVCQ